MGAITFISSTGTNAGKTFVTCALARALVARGQRVAAVKPIETGCDPDALDALALAEACGQPGLANHPGFYRARPPLAPQAVTLVDGTPPPNLDHLAQLIRRIAADHDHTLVEGAGGLLVPVDAQRTLANLAQKLGAPVILVAPNRLGVLSHVLTAHESAHARDLLVSLVILTSPPAIPEDPSSAFNRQILATHLPIPILTLTDDHAALVEAFLGHP